MSETTALISSNFTLHYTFAWFGEFKISKLLLCICMKATLTTSQDHVKETEMTLLFLLHFELLNISSRVIRRRS